jgi:hypothetical protein
MITYQIEQWPDIVTEMVPLFADHWKEVAVNQDTVPLDIDYAQYDILYSQGQLHITTARKDGILIAYDARIIRTHIHYKSTLFAFPDVYYVAPLFRRGRTVWKFFQFTEDTLRSRGVKVILTMTKKHLDASRLFAALGHTETEAVFMKFVGER